METNELEAVYRRHLAMVRGRARRIVGDPATAEDLAQEAFMRWAQHRRRGRREDNTSAFLYRVVTNLALNHLRDKKRQRAILEENMPEPSADGTDPTDRPALRQVLGRVKKDHAEVAAYYYFDGLDQEEIAELLDVPRRTIGRRLERFRAHARRLLEAQPRSLRHA